METLMHSRKKVYLLITLVLFSTLIVKVLASPNPTVTFHGGGVTIYLTYPEEDHPNKTITHDVTITANTNLTSINIEVLVYAPVDSTLQLITNQPLTWPSLHENNSLPVSEIPIILTEQVNGTLFCVITVQADQITDPLSYSFYTTRVSEITFSEMRTLYKNYETLLAEFNDLSINYTNSVEALNLLTTQHAELQTKYDSEVAAYNSLLSSNNQLSQEYNNLNANYKAKLTQLSASQSDYEKLNTTKNNLQTSYTTLQNVYNSLNQTYSDLLEQLDNLRQNLNHSESEAALSNTFMFIALMAVAGLVALIVYLKRKKPEPYMVIRKETVALENDETPTP
jgi:hypothetical protein